MRYLFYSFYFIALTTTSLAQSNSFKNKIDGVIINDTPSPIEFANVTLIKIQLLDSNHKLLKKGTLHYGQTLLARVCCTNMMGKPVKITLLEDDESGAGHNEKNNRNVMDSQTVTVDRNGVAEAIFLLSPAYIIKANKYGDGNTNKQHEYYILAEYKNQQKASLKTNVDNPTYKPSVKTIPEIATEKVQHFLKEKLNV